MALYIFSNGNLLILQHEWENVFVDHVSIMVVTSVHNILRMSSCRSKYNKTDSTNIKARSDWL